MSNKAKELQRDCTKYFRCSRKESEEISKEAEAMKMTESAYMRYRILKTAKPRLPPEVTTLLEELKYYDLKIGININQIVRSCNSKKFITEKDYLALTKNLELLNEKYDAIIRGLGEVMQNWQ